MVPSKQYENDAYETVNAFSKEVLMQSSPNRDEAFHGGILLNDTDHGKRFKLYVFSNLMANHNFDVLTALSLEGVLQMY